MAADSLGTAAGVAKQQRMGYVADGSKDPDAIGNKGYLLDPARIVPGQSDLADRELDDNHRSGPDLRHNRRANVAFCDGSVQKMDAIELGYAVGPNEELLPDGPGAHNRLFSGTGENKDPPRAR